MKTILPSYFVFSRATSLYQKTIRNVIPGKPIAVGLIIAVTLVILFIAIEKSHLKRHLEINLENAANDTTTCMTSLLILIGIMAIIVLIFTPVYSWQRFDEQNQEYNDNGFKVTNTNLLAVPAKLTETQQGLFYGLSVKNHLVNQTKTTKRNKFALYANVKRAKIKISKNSENDNYLSSKQAHYLGTMDHGKFKPAQTNTGATFANYQKYIVQHHLEQHFKKQMILVKSKKYLTPKYQPSLVLIGDNNYTLHLKQAKLINAKLDNNAIVAN